MRLFTALTAAALSFGAIAAAQAQAPAPAATMTNATASAQIKGAGSISGMAMLTDAPKGVLIRVEVSGLTPGWHGLHFHEKGDCSAADFTSAGAHVHGGATPAVHGLLNPAANDSGDLPNLYVGADGKGVVELFSALVSLKTGGGRPALLDADGSAIVVHANADDYKAQPIGGAGARVACGVIR